MFSACVVSDAACAAVNFLPVCALTSWMNSASSAHALALSFASADAWISLALLARLFPGPTPGRRRDQVLVLLAQGRVGDDDLRRIGRVRQPDECPAREEVRAATTATATATGRAERAPAAAAPEAAPTTSAGAPATLPAEAGLAVVAERVAAGPAHRARTGFTAESAVAAILAGRLRIAACSVVRTALHAAASTSDRYEQARAECFRIAARTRSESEAPPPPPPRPPRPLSGSLDPPPLNPPTQLAVSPQPVPVGAPPTST